MSSTINPLIDHLESLAGRSESGVYDPRLRDQAALAHLRRGLGKEPGEAPEMFPHVVPYRGKDTDKVYFLFASLFGLHPPDQPAKHGSIGHVMHEIYNKRNRPEGIEKRFTALLNAHEDDLPHHLRQIVSLAKTEGITIHYAELLKHLSHWSHPDHWVQLKWAEGFWCQENSPPDSSAPTPSITHP